MALREWFRANDFHPRTVNVVTEGAHARRTRLLFQKALGDETRVGVISIRSPDYDGERWWRYSEGLKEVLPEAIAYVYAKVFFRDGENGESRK